MFKWRSASPGPVMAAVSVPPGAKEYEGNVDENEPLPVVNERVSVSSVEPPAL